MDGNKSGLFVVAVLIITITGIVFVAGYELATDASLNSVPLVTPGTGSDYDSTLTRSSGVPVNLTQVEKTGSTPASEEDNVSYRTITDMAGRNVTIPRNISRTIGPKHFVDLIAPEKLAGWQPPSTNESRRFLAAIPDTIPVISETSTSYEANIALHPDIIFISCESGTSSASSADLAQEKYGDIPAVCVDYIRNATHYGPTIRFIGDVLGVSDRADIMLNYYNDVLAEVQTKTAALPDEKRVRVYYAEGTDGLSTDLSGSCHSQLIDLCGGINVAGNNSVFSSSSSLVTKESVLVWKPDVIITTSAEFYAQVYNESTWQCLPAVQNHRIYLTPNQPYNWFDRPPGINRIVGIPWTAHILYPELFPEDWFKKRVKEFYRIYYQYDLSDKELRELLNE